MTQPASGTGENAETARADALNRLVPLPDDEKRLRFTAFGARRKELLSDAVRSSRGGVSGRGRGRS